MKHSETANAIREKLNYIATKAVAVQYEENPLLWKKYGMTGKEKSLRDARYNLEYLADAIEAGIPEIFISYVDWLKVVLQKVNFDIYFLISHFELLHQALIDNLPDEQAVTANRYIEMAIKQLEYKAMPPKSMLDKSNPQYENAVQYMNFVLKGDRQKAVEFIINLAEKNIPLTDIYIHIFQTVQYEIGWLWQTNRITVAEEHYATAITQSVISQLYPYIFSTQKRGRTFIATCVNEELHELGVRMVSDFFEIYGWDTLYLGANTPVESIINMINKRKADLVGISATLTSHLKKVENLVTQIREDVKHNIKIMVGGQAFTMAPQFWRQINVDAYAENAVQSVKKADELFTSGR